MASAMLAYLSACEEPSRRRSLSTLRRLEAVAPGVVGNESTGVIFSVGAAARQPASSSFVLVPTSFVSAPSLTVS